MKGAELTSLYVENYKHVVEMSLDSFLVEVIRKL